MNNALLDKDFLKALDEHLEKEIYIKIISLDFHENPRTEIQGVATGGSINVDGSSAVRRTCNLNLVTKNAQVNEVDWALETKFKLQIGLKNFVNPEYEDIIWFPQGTYIVTSFSMTVNSQGFNISLQGKDKMCLLDGSIGGSLFASHDFGKLEVTSKADKVSIFEPILIHDIIQNAVHEYAFEPYENIIIEDLDDCAVELLEYRVHNKDAIIYDIHHANGGIDTNIAFEGNDIYSLLYQNEIGKLVDGSGGAKYSLQKHITYGDTIGYRLTDLTYPESMDLILSAGSSITQLLDAIVKVLGEFEYFYDLEGRFVFQRKKIYYNVAWTNAITHEKETYYDSVDNNSASTYTFTKGTLIESYANKPDIANIKNDFTIWGTTASSSTGVALPVHLRCAIDDKPTFYRPLLSTGIGEDPMGSVLFYTANYNDISNVVQTSPHMYDWRELLYRMAYDYSKSDSKILELEKKINQTSDIEQLESLKSELQLWKNTWNIKYISYFTDLLGFWRILYNPDDQEWDFNSHWNPTYISCKAIEQYVKTDKAGDGDYNYNEQTNQYEQVSNGDYIKIYNPSLKVNIIDPTIPFWFDFCDDSYLEKFGSDRIGKRPKVINDTEVKAIFFEETPNVLFIDPLDEEYYNSDTKLSYIKLNITGGMANYFQISTQGKSAKEVLDNLLYTHTYYCDSITITSVPIYYLQPNTRIAVYDETSGINGEYIIKSFNLQLVYNGSMSITATKAESLIL